MTEKCISCELTSEEIVKEYGQSAIEGGYHLEKGFLCEPCAEYDLTEPPLTVYHNSEDIPKRIGHYISDYWLEGEEAPFSFEWVPTDAWRGRYETKHNDGLVSIFDDSILSYHESEQMLKALHDIALKAFDLTNVDYYRVFSRTSNVFCTNMDIYIEKAKEELGNEIIETAKKYVNYDNPVFSTGILFPRDKPADFELGNIDAVKKADANEEIKEMILFIGQESLFE
jgi:hypothetical protein